MWRFPRLPRPSVFIAGPGDVADLRVAACEELAALRRRAADDHAVDLYDWVVDKSPNGFNHWSPPQSQIPSPSDERCRAVIGLFGAQIGTPLLREFETTLLGQFAERRGGFGVVHPWRPSAASRGGFALTGTVFECLAALNANFERGIRGDDMERGSPPILLLLVGEAAMHGDWVSADSAGGRLPREAESEFRMRAPERWESALAEWKRNEYEPQARQLANFFRYLGTWNIQPRVVADEAHARRYMRDFLSHALDLPGHGCDDNPFKGLEAYEREDWRVFYGRDAERGNAVERLSALWADPVRPTLFGFVGGSGVGKSSLMRAGVIAHLCHEVSDGRYGACIVRPSDLLVDALAPPESTSGSEEPDPLRRLLVCALAEIALEGDAAPPAGLWPEEAAAMLHEAVERRGAEWRFLIGLDQFEEVLDEPTEGAGAKAWMPVLEFIALVVRDPRIAVLYTLRDDRKALLHTHPLLGPLAAAGADARVLFPAQTIEEIIRRPFEVTGTTLEPALTDALRDRILQLVHGGPGGATDGILGLVSLVLHRLHEEGERRALARRATASSLAVPGAGEVARLRRGPELRLADCAALLDIQGAIVELADAAVAEGERVSGLWWTSETVARLLRSLVRIDDDERGGLRLPGARLPSKGPEQALAEALLRRRLLIPEGGRVRLVHAVVLHNWPLAAAWVASERRLLALAASVGRKARVWEDDAARGGRPPKSRQADVDEAAELLAGWSSVLADPGPATAEEVRLRRYGLALLRARPTPRRPVSGDRVRITHAHIAALYGDVELVKRYVAADPECVRAESRSGHTPLFAACVAGSDQVVEVLVDAGGNVEHAAPDGWRPLHAAAWAGRVECVEILLRGGASPAESTRAGRFTPLHVAAASGHPEVVARLLADARTDPLATSEIGWTALHYAAESGSAAAVRLLVGLDAGAQDTEGSGWTPLHRAAKWGRAEVVERLLEGGAAADTRLYNGWTPLHLAAEGGHLAAARRLLAAAGRRVDARASKRWETCRTVRAADLEWTPLHVAVDGRHEPLARLLLEAGADPNARTGDGRTALHHAVLRADAALIRLLAEWGGDLEADHAGRTPLHLALDTDQRSVAKVLLQAGACVDARSGGATPLHRASRRGDERLVRMLAAHGADVDAREDVGLLTPLHLAARSGNDAVVQLLLDHAARVDAEDEHGLTPLHLAAGAGNDAAVQLLLDNRARIGAEDEHGLTPLHTAAQAGRHAAAASLLAHPGARVDARDGDGWTPLHLAAQGGHAETIRVLLAHGAELEAVAGAPPLTALQAAAEVGETRAVAVLVEHGASLRAMTRAKGTPLALAVKNAQFRTAIPLLELGAGPSPPGAPADARVWAFCRAHRARRAHAGEPAASAESWFVQRLDAIGAASRAGLAPKGRAGGAPALDACLGLAWLRGRPELRGWLASRLGLIDGELGVDPAGSRIDVALLPWYSAVRLVRIRDDGWPRADLAVYYLLGPRRTLFRLDGHADPIYAVNAGGAIRLDDVNVIGYLRFFCFFVRSGEGPFYVIESADDPAIPPDADVATRSLLARVVSPAACVERDEDGRFLCRAVIWHSITLALAGFTVHPDGSVRMPASVEVADDLLACVDAPINWSPPGG